MKNAIVTGANGFVGSWVVKELLANKVKVYGVVHSEESDISRIDNLENMEIVFCDLEHISSLKEKILEEHIDVFYHFAWVGSAGILRADDFVQLMNAKYTCDAVRVAAEMNCGKFVLASSIMETECYDIMSSELAPGLSYIYATGKIAANYMARAIAADLQLPYMSGIISNIYGIGELSPRLINTSIKKLQKKEHASFSPGEQMYDFIYVSDAAKAFYAIGDKGQPNRNYYIGSLHPQKLKVFLEEMKNCIDSSAVLGLGDFAYNGLSLDYNKIDIEQLRRDTGFIPEISFKEGINFTAKWLETIERKEI